LHLELLQERDPKTHTSSDFVVSDVVVDRNSACKNTEGYNVYLGMGSLQVLLHLSKFQFAALKLLNVSLWHIDKINCQELGKFTPEKLQLPSG
jgi:hypothetical protein